MNKRHFSYRHAFMSGGLLSCLLVTSEALFRWPGIIVHESGAYGVMFLSDYIYAMRNPAILIYPVYFLYGGIAGLFVSYLVKKVLRRSRCCGCLFLLMAWSGGCNAHSDPACVSSSLDADDTVADEHRTPMDVDRLMYGKLRQMFAEIVYADRGSFIYEDAFRQYQTTVGSACRTVEDAREAFRAFGKHNPMLLHDSSAEDLFIYGDMYYLFKVEGGIPYIIYIFQNDNVVRVFSAK